MPNTDIRNQSAPTVNQVENTKPNVPTSSTILSGFLGNSMNAGHNKTIAFKQVMAGERIRELRLQGKFQLLTPLTPTYQQLKMNIKVYHVPNVRVWKNAEKFTSQAGGENSDKPQIIPNFGGKILPVIKNTNEAGTENYYMDIQHTTAWRDTMISSYIPRIGQMNNVKANRNGIPMPAYSALGVRGRIAIYNDYERNKDYDEERVEYNTDEVSEAEWQSYLPMDNDRLAFLTMRAKKPNSYFSDFRAHAQGFDEEYPPTVRDSNSLVNWAAWESKIAEARSQAENSQANDWDIIAKIRGSQTATQGKVQLIGNRTINLNYAAITQNTYNNNESVSAEFRVMGKQGAYSYTEIDMPIAAAIEFIEEGYIHVIATVYADTVYETALDRLEMNVNAMDMYRPDLVGDKLDLIYRSETGTSLLNSTQANAYYANFLGWKRKYNEYFKLPNCIAGDMTTKNYIQTETIWNGDLGIGDTEVITQKTFQFFMEGAEHYYDESSGTTLNLKTWKDYSDIMLNKNQAIKNELYMTGGVLGIDEIIIKGQNQIFFAGLLRANAELPIDEAIKHNYTQWGEH